MAMSLVQGLLNQGVQKDSIQICDPDAQQRQRFDDMAIKTFADNSEAVAKSHIVVLAVKPQIAASVLTNMPTLTENHLLISIAAGIDLKSLQNWTTDRQPIVRCMPNTPALLGAGMTGLFANTSCSQNHKEQAQALLAAAGLTLWVEDEPMLDAVTAVSGSGPAYFFLLMEAMVKAGEQLGLSNDVAKQLTLQTALGAAKMAQQGEHSPAQLRENVTSPGGTTAAALDTFAQAGFNNTVIQALKAAHQRAGELAEEFGK